MRGAFVVQLKKAAQGSQLEGLVEEVDTGKQAKFLSGDELIGFLRECSACALPGDQQNRRKDPNDRNDDRP